MAFRFPSEDVDEAAARDQIAKKLLVVGCPRSGTRYLTRALRRLGVGVRHEGMSVHGSVSSFLAFEDYWYPGSHGGRKSRYRFEQTWHLVRHPLRVIASLATPGAVSGEFLHWQEKHTGIPGDLQPRLLRCALIWCAFAEQSDSIATWTVRVEDLDSVWDTIQQRLGVHSKRAILDSLSKTLGRKTEPVAIGWEDLASLDATVANRVRELSSKFGYGDS